MTMSITSLARANTSSEEIFNTLYDQLHHRAAGENESLYQQALAQCRTPTQRKEMAGYYAGAWQKLFSAWTESKIPNVIALKALGHQSLSVDFCDDLIAYWA